MTDPHMLAQNFPTISESPENRHQFLSSEASGGTLSFILLSLSVLDKFHSPMPEHEEEPAKTQGELLIMTIEIGNGRKDTVHVFEGDQPEDLAALFCQKHNLNSSVIFPLSENIRANMQQVLNERAEVLKNYQSDQEDEDQQAHQYPDSEQYEEDLYSKTEPQVQQESTGEAAANEVWNFTSEPSKQVFNHAGRQRLSGDNYDEKNSLENSHKINMQNADNAEWDSSNRQLQEDCSTRGSSYRQQMKSHHSQGNRHASRPKTPDTYAKRTDYNQLGANYDMDAHIEQLYNRTDDYPKGR